MACGCRSCVRASSPQSPRQFNALACTLEEQRTWKISLNRRLITAQDDERRRTALELHDEVGPCLFGLKANAASIAGASARNFR